MPNKKKKYNARFPPARIKKIMQKDEEVGKVAAAVPVIISRSLELFVESLIKKTSEITQARNAKTLTISHLKQCILNENQFDFLKDLVASVPDVQADEDSSNPPSGDILYLKTSAQSYTKKQRVHHRARKKNDAGPSHTTTESDEDDSEEDDDDEDEEEDEEDSRSEDNSLPPKSIYLNSQTVTNNLRVNASPNGATSVIVSPVTFGPLTAIPATLTPNSAHLDEDYDSWVWAETIIAIKTKVVIEHECAIFH